jgi:hypothetical protein
VGFPQIFSEALAADKLNTAIEKIKAEHQKLEEVGQRQEAIKLQQEEAAAAAAPAAAEGAASAEGAPAEGEEVRSADKKKMHNAAAVPQVCP